MNNIIYIIDSLSPYALKSLSEKFYNIKIKKLTYFDKLINKSLLIKNLYGHGETYSTIFTALTGKDIYKNNCDSWYINNSFREFSDLGSFFKKKGYTNIFLRNASINSEIDNFYGRFLNSITKDFDYRLLKKNHKNEKIYDHIEQNKYFEILNNKNKKIFFLIHDMTLHDNLNAYNGKTKKILDVIDNELTENFKKTLSKINYDSKKDNLIVFSDHGLTVSPNSKLYTKKSVDRFIYEKLYKKIFVDEKIKMLFFNKSPKINNKKIINGNYLAKDLHGIIKKFFRNTKNIDEFLNFTKKQSKKVLTTSIRSVQATVYENYFEKNNFHNHIIYIKNKKKIIYSNKHENKFIEQIEDKFLELKKSKVDKNFKTWVDDYFKISNKIKKYLLFTKYKIIRLLIKLKLYSS